MYERYTKRITLGTDKCPILINTSKVFYCHLLGRSSKFIAPLIVLYHEFPRTESLLAQRLNVWLGTRKFSTLCYLDQGNPLNLNPLNCFFLPVLYMH